jgi:SNF5 / SMARCB1 / INI1
MFINEAAYGLDAGIRLDTESLCSSWSPTLEILTRDEIERREGDRERQIRRLKRDTARFGGLGSFAVVEEEILSSGRRRLKRKRSTSPAGRGTPRGAASRADSPAVVDVSVARATSLTDGFVLGLMRLIVGNGRDGDVRIVWFLGRERSLCGEDLMDQDNCVIIVEFGMQRLGKYRNGDDECMH